MKRTLSVALSIIMITIGLVVFMPKPTQVHAGSSASPVSDRNSTFFAEDALTDANQATLNTVQPAPKLATSLERANLLKRLQYMNDANRLGYIYLLSDMGSVISEYTIKGKPSSLSSMLTQTEQIRCKTPDSSVDHSCGTVSSPDLDGSYGDNPDGVFFFTTDGAYVEWAGKYLYSSQSMNINTPVTLTRDVK